MSENVLVKVNRPLHWFAVLTAVFTFLLLGAGGLVTSHEAGMSVPDWPTSYGYNMFALPIKFWTAGIFYEHTHRLLASGVGIFDDDSRRLALAQGFAQMDEMAGRHRVSAGRGAGRARRLRVTLKMAHLGIFHGVVAQLFFVLTCAIALFTSRLAKNRMVRRRGNGVGVHRGLRRWGWLTTILIFVQLILGATMRHQHAGLAIPDFPLAYGKIWPDTSADAVARYNADRVEVIAVNPITAFQIELQMVHRIVALAIFILVACALAGRVGSLGKNPLAKLAMFWLALIVCQIRLARGRSGRTRPPTWRRPTCWSAHFRS
jgi:heme a synthase